MSFKDIIHIIIAKINFLVLLYELSNDPSIPKLIMTIIALTQYTNVADDKILEPKSVEQVRVSNVFFAQSDW